MPKSSATAGTCDARFISVRETLEDLLATGDELGASIAIDLDGHSVVDVWGRLARREPHPTLAARHHHQHVVEQ